MNDYKRNALIFKAFCDENRLRIIELLSKGEKCACTLLEEVTIAQSTLSHHMKILVDSTIVSSRKEGKWTYYRLNTQGSEEAKEILKNILFETGEDQPCVVCLPIGGARK